MSCKRKTPSASTQAIGGPGFVAPKPVTHPKELAQVDSCSPLLLPGDYLTCMAKLGRDNGKHQLRLYTSVDGVWEDCFLLNLYSAELPELLLQPGESRSLADTRVTRQGDEVILTSLYDTDTLRLLLEEWNWLIELIHRHPTGIPGTIYFPVSAARQISYSDVFDETDDGCVRRIQLKVIGQRRELSAVRLRPVELQQLLNQQKPSGLRLSNLGDGWLAIHQDTGSGVLHMDELRLAWQCHEIREAAWRYEDDQRERWYRWQDEHGRIPSRKLAMKMAGVAAEEQFPGSRYAQYIFINLAYDADLWEELLERQGGIDDALEEGGE